MIQRKPRLMSFEDYQKFSVVIPLILTEQGYEIVFEVRASTLKKQPEEICFPGGRAEPGESPWETACRETCEELLIQKEMLAEAMPLDIFISPFDIIIYPYAAVLKDYEYTKNDSEVQEVFTVPWEYFKDKEPKSYDCAVSNLPGEDFPFEKIPGGRAYPWRQGKYEVNFYEYSGRVIWGLTAKIMKASVGLIEDFIRKWEEMNCEEEK